MIKEAIGTGRTVEDAIESACAAVGLPREELEIEVLDLPKKGFLGLSMVPARVRAYKEIPDESPAPAPKASPEAHARTEPFRPSETVQRPDNRTRAGQKAPGAAAADAPGREEMLRAAPPKQEENKTPAFVSTPESNAKAQAAADYVASIIAAMGIVGARVSSSQTEGNIVLKLTGDSGGVAIGHRGETLDAIQYLAGLSTNRLPGDYMRVIIDSGNYREKRKAVLEELAKRIASNVLKSGRSYTLEPMNPYERRIIHSAVSEMEGVSSTSVGEEPNRRVVINSKNPRRGSGENREKAGGRGPRGAYAGASREEGRRDDGRRDKRSGGRGGPRREKPQPYKESSVRETPPAEAVDKPLYGKIEL